MELSKITLNDFVRPIPINRTQLMHGHVICQLMKTMHILSITLQTVSRGAILTVCFFCRRFHGIC